MSKLKKAFNQFLIEKVIPNLGYFVIMAVFSSIKMRWLQDKIFFERIKAGKPMIFAFWHNRLIYMPYAYTQVGKTTNLVTLISKSKDGRIAGNICRRFGMKVAHGSTSRGGSEALREIIRLVRDEKMDCGITPDGPRGPKYKLQPGVVTLAQVTGAPIIPIFYDVKTKLRLKTWDGFIIPLPFTYGYMSFSEPIYVPSDISEQQHKEFQSKVETAMITLSQDVKNRFKEKK